MNPGESKNADEKHYSFILFVIENGVNSKRAKENLDKLCQKWLSGRHTIEIIDILKDFQTALDHNVLLTPSVVLVTPEPQIVIHGDLSEPRSFLEALNLDQDENGR